MVHCDERSPKVLSQSQLTGRSQAPVTVTSYQLLLIPFSVSFSCEIRIFIL